MKTRRTPIKNGPAPGPLLCCAVDIISNTVVDCKFGLPALNQDDAILATPIVVNGKPVLYVDGTKVNVLSAVGTNAGTNSKVRLTVATPVFTGANSLWFRGNDPAIRNHNGAYLGQCTIQTL